MSSFDFVPDWDKLAGARWSQSGTKSGQTVGTVHVVVPEGIHDPTRPSGGNRYDQKVCAGLRDQGWVVQVREVAGPWPGPDTVARAALGAALADIPDGVVVLLDGLLASALPEVLVPEARRLRLVVLVHLPLGVEGGARSRAREYAVLLASRGVVATSRWSREWLLGAYASLAAELVHVAHPGVAPAPVVSGSGGGGRLVCVGAVTPTKGQDVLIDALPRVADLEWTCQCVGSATVDPAFVEKVRARADGGPLAGRVTFVGTRAGTDLDAIYGGADLVVAPSRTETYGMVITEALARGIPVVGSEVGGLPEALGTSSTGQRPGLLVPPDDAAKLAAALRRWLTEADLRDSLRDAALERRTSLTGWSETTSRVAQVLREVAA